MESLEGRRCSSVYRSSDQNQKEEIGMAKKSVKDAGEPTNTTSRSDLEKQSMQLPPADVRFQAELEVLRAADNNERPDGWLLSPQAVVDFICGTDGQKIGASKSQEMVIAEKFVGPRDLIQRCVVTLAGERGLLLVGEPGTAKSMLGELWRSQLAERVGWQFKVLPARQRTKFDTAGITQCFWIGARCLRLGPVSCLSSHAIRSHRSLRRSDSLLARSSG